MRALKSYPSTIAPVLPTVTLSKRNRMRKLNALSQAARRRRQVGDAVPQQTVSSAEDSPSAAAVEEHLRATARRAQFAKSKAKDRAKLARDQRDELKDRLSEYEQRIATLEAKYHASLEETKSSGREVKELKADLTKAEKEIERLKVSRARSTSRSTSRTHRASEHQRVVELKEKGIITDVTRHTIYDLLPLHVPMSLRPFDVYK